MKGHARVDENVTRFDVAMGDGGFALMKISQCREALAKNFKGLLERDVLLLVLVFERAKGQTFQNQPGNRRCCREFGKAPDNVVLEECK